MLHILFSGACATTMYTVAAPSWKPKHLSDRGWQSAIHFATTQTSLTRSRFTCQWAQGISARIISLRTWICPTVILYPALSGPYLPLSGSLPALIRVPISTLTLFPSRVLCGSIRPHFRLLFGPFDLVFNFSECNYMHADFHNCVYVFVSLWNRI